MSDHSAQQLAPILEANPTLIGLATFVLGIIVTIWTTRFAGYSLRETLEDPASRSSLIANYRKPDSEAYFQAVTRVLTFAEDFYGTRLISWQSFGRCLTLAYLYPMLAALLGWVIYNAGSPGGLDLFSQDLTGPTRALVAGGLLISFPISAFLATKARAFAEWALERVDRALPSSVPRTSFLSKALRATANFGVGAFVSAFAGAFLIAFAVALAVAGASAFAVGFAITFAFAGAFAVAFVGAFAGALAIAYTVALAGASAFAGAGTDPELLFTALLLVFVFTLLPLLNAIADTLSVAITRKFLGHLKRSGTRPGLRRILVHLALDILLALGCLVLLLISLRLCLDLWGRLSPDTLPFDWRVYIDTIQDDWRHGTALYLMVFTTLIPTLVHVIAGLGAVLTHRSRMLDRVADTLVTAPDTLSKAEINRLVAQVRNAHFFHGTLATMLVIGGFWILWRVVGEVLTRLPFLL